MDIIAQLSSHQFYQEKGKLCSGAYEVVEHDGEINIATVGTLGIKWYSPVEWEEHKAEYDRLDHDLSTSWMDDYDVNGDPWHDAVDPRHVNDCDGCGHCHLCDDHLAEAGDYTARNEQHQQMNSVAFNSIHGSMGSDDVTHKLPEGKTLGQILKEFKDTPRALYKVLVGNKLFSVVCKDDLEAKRLVANTFVYVDTSKLQYVLQRVGKSTEQVGIVSVEEVDDPKATTSQMLKDVFESIAE